MKTEILYENDSTFSFLDHLPLSTGHEVVILKTHFVNIYDIDYSTLNKVTRVAKLLAIKLSSNSRSFA
ncbi:MAG: HIT domain-containing protein [Candidatus Thermoplasmatota archaeon]|nr:HIT domain-containing protein [Candidatus Thermoplasmatota archaeon]